MTSPKNDITFERIFLALFFGGVLGFYVGRMIGDYVIWITLGCSLGLALETVTRTSSNMKAMRPPERPNLPSKGFKPPNFPKPPRVV